VKSIHVRRWHLLRAGRIESAARACGSLHLLLSCRAEIALHLSHKPGTSRSCRKSLPRLTPEGVAESERSRYGLISHRREGDVVPGRGATAARSWKGENVAVLHQVLVLAQHGKVAMHVGIQPVGRARIDDRQCPRLLYRVYSSAPSRILQFLSWNPRSSPQRRVFQLLLVVSIMESLVYIHTNTRGA